MWTKFQDMQQQEWRLTLSNDIITEGLARLAYQFKDSVNFRSFIEAFLQQFQDLDISGLQLLNERYLNTAVGAQLDGIGEIVGLERPERDKDLAGIFGFKGDLTALGFGDINDPDIGGNFWDGVSSKVLIGDDLYRLLIRAKIIKNQTAMTVDDTLRLISFTFGDIDVRYFLTTNLKPRYDIGKILTPFEISLLPDLPVLIGIDKVEYHIVPEVDAFGFKDDPDALGFGDFNNPDVGGNFSAIVT